MKISDRLEKDAPVLGVGMLLLSVREAWELAGKMVEGRNDWEEGRLALWWRAMEWVKEEEE